MTRRGHLLATGLVLVLAAGSTLAAPALGEAERAEVFAAAGLLARDGGHYRDGCDTPLRPSLDPVDLNGDGRAEALLYLAASRCFPESQGGNVALFARDASGRWIERLGYVPGVEAVVQASRQHGWADLGVANPGGCMPVYRWDGKVYVRTSQKALQPGGCQFRE